MAEEGEDSNFALLEWRVDNFGCWNKNFHDKMIPSPKLQVAGGFSCTFELYPRGLTGCDEHMGLRVCYTADFQTSGEITFVGSDGRLLCVEHKEDFAWGDRVVLIHPPAPKFHEYVDKIRKNVAWYKDRLTLRLRIRNVPSPSVLRVRTKIKAMDTTYRMQQSTFICSPGENFCAPVHIADVDPFASNDGALVELALEAAINDLSFGSKVKLKLKGSHPVSYLSNFLVYTRLSVLDSDDVVLRSEDNEHVFVNDRGWTFSKSLTRGEVYSKDVSLLLRVKIVPNKRYKHRIACEFNPRKVDVLPTFRTEHHFTSVYKESDLNEHSVRVLSKQLSCLYHQDQEFSDFRLKCENVTFPVHKNILAARSPVFKSLFLSDMKEAASGCVDIVDLDAPTLSLFLAFLYTGEMDHLQGESALKLYYAAEKYLVPSLKRECADFLSANVSNSNVCDVLSFADRHKDDQMSTAALDFVFKKYNVVLISKEWDIFMEREPELAARVVSLMAERRG